MNTLILYMTLFCQGKWGTENTEKGYCICQHASITSGLSVTFYTLANNHCSGHVAAFSEPDTGKIHASF